MGSPYETIVYFNGEWEMIMISMNPGPIHLLRLSYACARQREPRCRKGSSSSICSTTRGRNSNLLIWLKHDDARFPQPFIERAMISQRCAYKLCISPERVSQAVFHVFTSSARLRVIPLVYVDSLSTHPGHSSHSYLVVDLYGFIDKPSAA